MDSYGEILRNAREEKNLDLDKVSREISIEKRYLEGLENEDDGVFPGEAYLVGFLRNYSNYLELNTEQMLRLFNNKKLQEMPVPEGLIAKHRSKKIVPAIVIPTLLVTGVVAAVLVLLLITRKKPVEEGNVIVSKTARNRQFELDNSRFQSRVFKGDQFIIPTETGRNILTVRDTISSFGLETPAGTFYTDLSQENEVDINGDGVPDLIVYVSDISYTDESRGAEVSILLRHGISTIGSGTYEADIPLASEIVSSHPRRTILEDNRAYPFTINATFRGPCLFRNKVDNDRSVESYFSNGEVFTANPHNGIRLWISNGNTVRFSITADSRTFDLDIGPAGEVIVEDIKWIKDTDGKYKLVVIELD